MMKRKCPNSYGDGYKSILRLILVSVLTCFLILGLSFPAFPQLPFAIPNLPNSENNDSLWNLNLTLTEPCGEMMCSTVLIDGDFLLTVTAQIPALERDRNAFSSQQRATQIQKVIRRIIRSRMNWVTGKNLLNLSLLSD